MTLVVLVRPVLKVLRSQVFYRSRLLTKVMQSINKPAPLTIEMGLHFVTTAAFVVELRILPVVKIVRATQ